MKRRWSVVLPIIGLLLFAGETWDSVRMNRHAHTSLSFPVPSRYFWWSAIRLDKHPLARRPVGYVPCDEDATRNCVAWDPTYISVDPGWLAKAAIIWSLPAFVVGGAVVRVLGRAGLNEMWSFFVVMPVLVAAWSYFVGWGLDRWRHKRTASAPPSSKL